MEIESKGNLHVTRQERKFILWLFPDAWWSVACLFCRGGCDRRPANATANHVASVNAVAARQLWSGDSCAAHACHNRCLYVRRTSLHFSIARSNLSGFGGIKGFRPFPFNSFEGQAAPHNSFVISPVVDSNPTRASKLLGAGPDA
jgi:hypothetical protein